jgi:hypothetical protein
MDGPLIKNKKDYCGIQHTPRSVRYIILLENPAKNNDMIVAAIGGTA